MRGRTYDEQPFPPELLVISDISEIVAEHQRILRHECRFNLIYPSGLDVPEDGHHQGPSWVQTGANKTRRQV
jgi:hypothetical protein